MDKKIVDKDSEYYDILNSFIYSVRSDKGNLIHLEIINSILLENKIKIKFILH